MSSARRPSRRVAIIALAGGAAVGRAAANTKDRPWRVGTVFGVSEPLARPLAEEFLAAMKELGYVVGQNLHFEQRFAAGDPARYPELIDQVLATKPDVLIGSNTAVALRMRALTREVPIVLATTGDAVGDGLVQSLAQPGGNVTGISLQLGELGAKHVELITELVPRTRAMAVLVDTGPANTSRYQADQYLRLVASAASPRRIAVQVHDYDNLDATFERIQQQRPDVLLVFMSPRLNSLRRQIAAHAVRARLPSIAQLEGFAQDGGLMNYGPSFIAAFRQVARFVDRILRGAKPAELPVEQPTRFELTLNRSTAGTLGLSVHPAFALRVDRTID